VKELAKLTPEIRARLKWHWPFWARPNQNAPEGDWATWLVLAGRGFGKTEAGAQWIRQRVRNGARNIALIAETQKDLEEVMVARIISVSPPDERPTVRYKPVRLLWPNGAQALGYNGTEPDQLRGPEFDTCWCDEFAKYRYARDLWDMLQFTMRKPDPRVLVTTTPRPIPVLKEILADPRTVTTRGSTLDNKGNLPSSFIKAVIDKYEGTRLGRQELNAEILDDVPGALWSHEMIDAARIDEAPDLRRIVVAVDPSGTKGGPDSDEVGIVIAGQGFDGRAYVLADWTCNLGPAGWGRRAVEAYQHFRADRIVAESNYGGAMVESTIRAVDQNAPVSLVTASRGKVARAEPIAALFEQNRVSIVGSMPQLEDQLCGFTPSGFIGEKSPDRADAMVWALTELMLDDDPNGGFLALIRADKAKRTAPDAPQSTQCPYAPGSIEYERWHGRA
jgi:phage terminase large subunit-like protein